MIFSFGKDKKKIEQLESQVKELSQILSTPAMPPNSTRVYPDYYNYTDKDAYSTIDDIYSIVSYCAQNTALVPLYAYAVVNDPKAKRLKSASPLSFQYEYLKIKALEDLPENDKFAQFWENPFFNKSKFEGLVELYSWLYISDEAFIYKDRKVSFGVNSTVDKLHILEPYKITLIVTTNFPQKVLWYEYTHEGTTYRIMPEDMIHVKGFNPEGFGVTSWRGLSRIKVAAKRLTRINANMDASVAQLQNGGVPAIVYSKEEAGIETADKHRENFARFINNSANKGAPYFSGNQMEAIQLGTKLTDMEVAELGKIDFKKLCNLWHISDVLFNNDERSTYNNVKESKASAYTECFLPTVFIVRDALNRSLVNDFRDKKRQFQEDISDISVLQENIKDKYDAIKDIEFISNNEKRQMFKWDKSDNPLMDEIIVSSGKMLLSDLSIPDVNLDNGQNQSADSGQSV